MEFNCVCGEVVSITVNGGESELNVQVVCEGCETKYAVTITPFEMKHEMRREVS